MTIGDEYSFLTDLIIHSVDNTSNPPSLTPTWLSRPVSPEGLIAVTTPSNIPYFDPTIWRKGEVPTAFAEQN